MTIAQIMDRHLVAVSPNTSIGNAIKLMKGSNVDLLLVLQDGRLMGLVGEAALADTHLVDISSAPVSGIMQEPWCVEEKSSIDDAVKYVIEHNLSRLPVVSSKKSMQCTGTVGSTELARAKKQEGAGAH
jgi:osmoprotectant transport system ATP-binding protein